MCGRFALALPHDQIQALDGYDVPIGEWVNRDEFQPRYNIAPRSQAPVVRRRHIAGASAEDNASEVVMQTMKWGVVPHWSKHEDNNLSTINARCENLIHGGGMWGSLRGRKRCAIPCQGYYEWLKKGKDRVPHFVKRDDGKLMLLAGLYDVATLEGETTPLYTFTVVTTDANKEFMWLHDRQPVVLPTSEALKAWLDTSSQQWTPECTKLVQPYSDVNVKLICYAVPKEVGKVGVESPTFIEPIAQRSDGIQAMFAKQKKAVPQPETEKTSIVTPEKPKKAKEAKRRSVTPEHQPTPLASPTKRKKRSVSPEQPSSSRTTPVKRRKLHESSPTKSTKQEVIDLCDTDEDKAATKTKTEKLNTWEDESNIEYPKRGDKHEAKPSTSPQSKGSAKKGRVAKTKRRTSAGT